MRREILALDIAGAPHSWLAKREAVQYYAANQVAWSAGRTEFVFRGGTQRASGARSVIRASSIIAIKGRNFIVRNFDQVPALTREMLFVRDRNVCAYCAQRFRFKDLEIEHIVPSSRGGESSWMNLVAACRACNCRKANRTPEEAGMKLHYVPYVPNRYEAFILENRRIRADQMEFLLQGVPRTSRLRA
jgi:5-methylcytosine-specific restriction endonuclease McrA